MKQSIKTITGLVLLIVWGLGIILCCAEPTSATTPDNPEWVGWAFIIFMIGTPFALINLIDPTKP